MVAVDALFRVPGFTIFLRTLQVAGTPPPAQDGRIQVLVETLNNVTNPTRWQQPLDSVRPPVCYIVSTSPQRFSCAHIVQSEGGPGRLCNLPSSNQCAA